MQSNLILLLLAPAGWFFFIGLPGLICYFWTKVFFHLFDDFLFVERGVDKSVNPLEFRGQFGKRNG